MLLGGSNPRHPCIRVSWEFARWKDERKRLTEMDRNERRIRDELARWTEQCTAIIQAFLSLKASASPTPSTLLKSRPILPPRA